MIQKFLLKQSKINWNQEGRNLEKKQAFPRITLYCVINPATVQSVEKRERGGWTSSVVGKLWVKVYLEAARLRRFFFLFDEKNVEKSNRITHACLLHRAIKRRFVVPLCYK